MVNKRRKKTIRMRILLIVMAVLLVASLVTVIVLLSRNKSKGKTAEALVVRASLSSTLTSTGLVKNISFDAEVPLAALTVEAAEKFGDIMENDYALNLITLLGEGKPGPYLYRVSAVNEALVGKENTFSTEDENCSILTLVPIYFDWEKASEHYALEVSAGTTEAGNVKEYVISLLLREGFSDMDPSAFPDEFWREDPAGAVTVDTAKLGALILAELQHVEQIEFTVSELVLEKGDVLMLDNKLFNLSYSELFAAFTLSEYDVPSIHTRLLQDERVYAAVGINALSGRTLLAEIVEIEQGNFSSGISYFTVLGRLVFPKITTDAAGAEQGSYTYYDSTLTDSTVTYLGLDLSDNLREEEILEGYSVSVSAQKAVVEDTLIVATKCIYYDDAKKPYVVVLDENKKEKRVYIKITLSTGTDAAVTAADGYTLNEGDILRYTADATLMGSLF